MFGRRAAVSAARVRVGAYSYVLCLMSYAFFAHIFAFFSPFGGSKLKTKGVLRIYGF